MWKVVDQLTGLAMDAARKEGIRFLGSEFREEKRVGELLDRFEKDFFVRMEEIIREKEREDADR